MDSRHIANSLVRLDKRGQNVIEYLLVVAVVAFVAIIFFNPSGGPGRTALENITNDMVDDIARLNNEIVF